MMSGPSKGKVVVSWSPHLIGSLKFNVGGAARGKPGPAGIRGVLRNCKGEVLFMFSKHVEKKGSNEAEILAI